jgi:hypothetical protein
MREIVGKAMAEFLAGVDDLDAASRAVDREREIRIGMARTGEGREVVADFLDAQAAMDDEMILDLTDGQPTTLVDALTRYLEELERRDELQPRARVAGELAAILAFPWPEDERRVQLHNPHYGLMLHIEEEENRDLVIRMGNNRWEVCRVNWEDAGSGGQRECQAVAEAVYRATLARVIPDRDHDVRRRGTQPFSVAGPASGIVPGLGPAEPGGLRPRCDRPDPAVQPPVNRGQELEAVPDQGLTSVNGGSPPRCCKPCSLYGKV